MFNYLFRNYLFKNNLFKNNLLKLFFIIFLLFFHFFLFLNFFKNSTFLFFDLFLFLFIFYFIFVCFLPFFYLYISQLGIIILNSVILLFLLIVTFLISFFFNEFFVSYTLESQINLGVFSFFFLNLSLNYLSLEFIKIVLAIAFFVVPFSWVYLFNNKEFFRFFFLLNLFVVFMLGVLLSQNFLLLIFFWEGIGLSSFFLISFFYNKSFIVKSAFKAFFFNRISDIFLIFSAILYYFCVGSWVININYYNLYLLLNYKINFFIFEISIFFLFLFFLMIVMFIKSAQLGFHIWLPDSMEAPIPASALIHSATLVASGIYLHLKFILWYNFSYFFIIIFLFINTVTMFFGSISAAFQTDLKKILAYSTISNCGLMFLLNVFCSLKTSIFFFSYHGLLKSYSFLIIGIFILFNKHYQDARLFTKNYNYIYYLNFFFIIIIFLLGGSSFFFSSFLKHNLILSIGSYNLNFTYTLKYIFYLNSIISMLYVQKIIFLVYFSKNGGFKNNYIKLNYNSLLFNNKVKNFFFLEIISFGFFFFIFFFIVLLNYNFFFLLLKENFIYYFFMNFNFFIIIYFYLYQINKNFNFIIFYYFLLFLIIFILCFYGFI